MSAELKPEFMPLRQRVTSCDAARFTFPKREVLDCLSRPERFQLEPCGAGGKILAANERTLFEAQLVLREACGATISFDEPTVYTYTCPLRHAVVTPVMFVRVDAPRAVASDVAEELRRRDAHVLELDLQARRAVARAEIRLRDLLGLERQILELTDGSAFILSWLMRYDPESAESNASEMWPRDHGRHISSRSARD